MRIQIQGLVVAACLPHVACQALAQTPADDPYADMTLTCQEMRQQPERIFGHSQDLGSGNQSPLAVDYACPESLAQLPLLRKIGRLAGEIRSEGGETAACSGSIRHLHHRVHLYAQLELGFAPQLVLEARRSMGYSNVRWIGEWAKYFRRWSFDGPYERRKYREFMKEQEAIQPALVDFFETRRRLTRADAIEAAEVALDIYRSHAAGSFPSSSDEFTAETMRVTSIADRIDDSHLPDELGPEDLKLALRIALLMNRPGTQIAALVARVGDLNYGDESPLFSAVGDRDNVALLLDRGADVNYENGFGKTALFYAIQFNDRPVVRLLLERGADVNHRYRDRPGDGDFDCRYAIHHTARTTLMHAAAHSDVTMLKLLLAHGARLGDVDGAGFNAVDHALAAANPRNAAFLESKGLRSLIVEKSERFRACMSAIDTGNAAGAQSQGARCYAEIYGDRAESGDP